MILERLDLVQAAALLDHGRHSVDLVAGQLQDVVNAVKNNLNNLRVFAAKQITERRDDALLNEIGNLLFVAGNCQI